MSYTVTRYPANTFCWADVYSTDIAQTKAFLTKLFDWTTQEIKTGEVSPDYTLFSLQGKLVAGGSQAYDQNLPSFWSNQVSVENVDAMVKKSIKLGGKIIYPAMDVMDAGRMATIQDPTGATLTLWQPKNHIGAQIVNQVGAMCWNELYTRDVPAAKKFYGELFGWTFTEDESKYINIANQGRGNGGIFEITAEMGQMPPMWMVYFTVEDIEESIKKVTELGGKVWMGPKEVSVGKIAWVSEPAGAGFMLIQMSVKPEEWVE